MPKARLRARRSRYRFTTRLSRSAPAVAISGLLVVALIGTSLAAGRVIGFLNHVTAGVNPVKIVEGEIDPPKGSLKWKLRHGQQINILMLGYGGKENDAPYLTDSIMVITLDPAHRRVIETSVPRDLWVRIDAWPDGRTYEQKINAAYEVGVVDSDWRGKSPQYSGRDGGGHLAEHVLGKVTGLQFDRYVGVDFKAFRDVVDALGGVDVHMDGPLDDCHYPDYHDGYMNHGVPPGYRCPRGAGIHFKAGDYAVNGEQALELARSRDATQPEQASDFGRSRRQQMLTAAIKKKSLSANGIAKALPLMTALESNFRTDMDINDIKALYDWGAGIPESAFVHVALTNADLLDEAGGCAQGGVYALCPEDASYRMLHAYVAATAVDPKIPAEKAPLQVVNGSNNSPDLGDRVNKSLQPLGFVLSDPARKRAVEHSVIYDYSGGKYPLTAAWMAAFFNAQVVPVDPAAPLPTGAGQKTDGLVVVLGHDFALRWYGLTR